MRYRNRALDRLRRDAVGAAKVQEAAVNAMPDDGGPHDGGPDDPDDPTADGDSGIVDNRLRLMFTCCHPALALDARVALTLRTLGGLTTTEIARAFPLADHGPAPGAGQAQDPPCGHPTGCRPPTSCRSGRRRCWPSSTCCSTRATPPPPAPIWCGPGCAPRRLYRQLARFLPSAVVELNRAVAVAMADGPAAGLALVERLEASGALAGYHLLPATRADLLRRLDRFADAADAYRQALALAANEADRRYLTRRLAEVT